MSSLLDSPHLTEELIDRFLACKAARRENRAVVLHLLRGCPECSAKLWRRWRPAPDADFEAALFEVMEAWAARAQADLGKVIPFTRPATRRRCA